MNVTNTHIEKSDKYIKICNIKLYYPVDINQTFIKAQ